MHRTRRIANQISSLAKKNPVICFVGDPKVPLVNEFLKHFTDDINLVVGNDIDTLRQNPLWNKAEAMIWLFNCDMNTFVWAYDQLSGQIRWIHSFSVGVDKLNEFISTRLQQRPDVTLTNARGAYSSSLAEYVLCAMLYFNKRIPRILENQKKKNWDKFVMGELRGKTMGLVGFGDIGIEVARKAKLGLGMRILALRRDPTKGDANGLADKVFGHENRLELFRNSDVVVCSLPETNKTKKYCGEEEFSAMRTTATFISIGRGTVVCEAALYRALRFGCIANAAMDVFQEEPLKKDSPLWELDNLLITAHNADNTSSLVINAYKVWRENYLAFCDSRPLLTIVNKTHKY